MPYDSLQPFSRLDFVTVMASLVVRLFSGYIAYVGLHNNFLIRSSL